MRCDQLSVLCEQGRQLIHQLALRGIGILAHARNERFATDVHLGAVGQHDLQLLDIVACRAVLQPMAPEASIATTLPIVVT